MTASNPITIDLDADEDFTTGDWQQAIASLQGTTGDCNLEAANNQDLQLDGDGVVHYLSNLTNDVPVYKDSTANNLNWNPMSVPEKDQSIVGFNTSIWTPFSYVIGQQWIHPGPPPNDGNEYNAVLYARWENRNHQFAPASNQFCTYCQCCTPNRKIGPMVPIGPSSMSNNVSIIMGTSAKQDIQIDSDNAAVQVDDSQSGFICNWNHQIQLAGHTQPLRIHTVDSMDANKVFNFYNRFFTRKNFKFNKNSKILPNRMLPYNYAVISPFNNKRKMLIGPHSPAKKPKIINGLCSAHFPGSFGDCQHQHNDVPKPFYFSNFANNSNYGGLTDQEFQWTGKNNTSWTGDTYANNLLSQSYYHEVRKLAPFPPCFLDDDFDFNKKGPLSQRIAHITSNFDFMIHNEITEFYLLRIGNYDLFGEFVDMNIPMLIPFIREQWYSLVTKDKFIQFSNCHYIKQQRFDASIRTHLGINEVMDQLLSAYHNTVQYRYSTFYMLRIGDNDIFNNQYEVATFQIDIDLSNFFWKFLSGCNSMNNLRIELMDAKYTKRYNKFCNAMDWIRESTYITSIQAENRYRMFNNNIIDEDRVYYRTNCLNQDFARFNNIDDFMFHHLSNPYYREDIDTSDYLFKNKALKMRRMRSLDIYSAPSTIDFSESDKQE